MPHKNKGDITGDIVIGLHPETGGDDGGFFPQLKPQINALDEIVGGGILRAIDSAMRYFGHGESFWLPFVSLCFLLLVSTGEVNEIETKKTYPKRITMAPRKISRAENRRILPNDSRRKRIPMSTPTMTLICRTGTA